MYELENAATLESSVAQLKNLGQDILTAKYETKFSSYTFPPEEINARAKVSIMIIESEEALISYFSDNSSYTFPGYWWSMGETCRSLSTQESSFRNDLARETFREKMERLFEQHTRVNERLHQWVAEKKLISMSKKTVITLPSLRYSPYLCIVFIYFSSIMLKKFLVFLRSTQQTWSVWIGEYSHTWEFRCSIEESWSNHHYLQIWNSIFLLQSSSWGNQRKS